MESSLLTELSAIFLLILANGFFALSEFSIIASRKSKIQHKIEAGKRGAKRALQLHENPEKFLATVQVGITLFATLAGVFGGATFVDHLQPLIAKIPVDFIVDSSKTISVSMVALLITIFSVIFGELVPKYMALSHPEYYARHVARPITLFIKLTSFFSSSLSAISSLILKILGIKVDNDRSLMSEEEINQMIFEGKQKGLFDETEEKLIKSVFDFADSTVRRAMTPRTVVEALNINANSDDIFKAIIEHGYSRYPIYEDSIDNIIGILYTKDIIIHKMNPELIIIKDLLREPLYVPDSMPLSRLLEIFQKKKKHLAVVLDEFGGTAGIISIEDLLEELVGEIQDEYDAEREPLVKHSDNIAYAEGNVWVGAVNELLRCSLPEDKAETIGGLVIDFIGTVPYKNQIIEIADIEVTVLEIQENRILRMKLEKKIKNENTRESK